MEDINWAEVGPELLEALEALLLQAEAHIPDHIATDPDHPYGKAEDTAHATIAKARGTR